MLYFSFTNLSSVCFLRIKPAQLCPCLSSKTVLSLYISDLLSPRVPSHLYFLSAPPNWIKLAIELLFLFPSFISKGWYEDSKQVQHLSDSVSSAEHNFHFLYLSLWQNCNLHQGHISFIFSVWLRSLLLLHSAVPLLRVYPLV